ncbi:hypothetical protein FK004_05635 [Flavobacterium kingsejongi]|uniref:Uncharacterized protein n=2 Tax=Flavobacterium kingsejongi TaxID=1678728 RepID=A0A2S1LLX5_9FLAO|nr:hypothetical protein FK004_05635 [Flavobacterium kingsejongi]
MKAIVTISITFLFSILGYSQNLKKKTVYFLFEKNKTDSVRNLGYKFYREKEKGYVFNLMDKNVSLLYKNKQKSDTLPLSKLKNYKITPVTKIDVLEKEWYYRNKEALIKKYTWFINLSDRNAVFKTFLIEIINDKQFVVYPVTWRNQNATD